MSKAYKTLELIHRMFHFSSAKTFKLQYISLVRSQLTYCSAIQRPHLLKDIALLETVQKGATKWILRDYTSDNKSRLETLQLLPIHWWWFMSWMMSPSFWGPSIFLTVIYYPIQCIIQFLIHLLKWNSTGATTTQVVQLKNTGSAHDVSGSCAIRWHNLSGEYSVRTSYLGHKLAIMVTPKARLGKPTFASGWYKWSGK